MALAPETRYAVAREGHHLAYQVTGDGGRDILFVAEERTPIDLLWDDPLVARALSRLASGAVPPLVSGSGLSFEARGTHDLKGVPDPWPVLAVRR